MEKSKICEKRMSMEKACDSNPPHKRRRRNESQYVLEKKYCDACHKTITKSKWVRHSKTLKHKINYNIIIPGKLDIILKYNPSPLINKCDIDLASKCHDLDTAMNLEEY